MRCPSRQGCVPHHLAGQRWSRQSSCLYGVVENDADRMALTRAYPAHTMAQVDAIHATRALYRPMMDREDHAVPLAERYHLSARLLTRSLLREHEFAAREVVSWHRQEEGDL